jgi:hypothetical protein
MAIEFPERHEGRAAFRRLLEACAQSTPLTAAIAHLYGYTHPSQFEQELEQYQREIGVSLNDHGERIVRLEEVLAPRAAAGALALDLAFHILRANNTGRGGAVDFEALCETFSDIDRSSLEEAVAELKHLEYATTEGAWGHPILNVRPTASMFLAFDLVATGRDTRADALLVARRWLDEPEAQNVFRLSEQLGWEPRRLNPALSTLRHVFAQGRWSNESDPTLEVVSVLVTQDERFKLRRMLESGRVD